MVATYSGIRVDDDGTTTWPLTSAGVPIIADEPPFATLTGASNTALITYRNRLLLLDPGGTLESFSQFFIPLNATVAFPIGTQLKFIQSTLGIQAINGVTGVTVTTTKSMQMEGLGARVTAQKIAINTWILFGDLMPPTRGITQWNDSFAYQTAPDGGIKGSTTGFWIAVDGMINSQVLNTTRFLTGKSNGTPTGWGIQGLTTNATIRGFVSFITAGTINSPAYTVVADDIGKHNLIVLVYDPAGTGTVRLYVRDVEVGTGTNAASAVYAPTPASVRTTLARRPDVGANAPSDWTIYGAVGGDAFVPSLAEIQNLYIRWKATGSVQPIPSKTTRRWTFRSENVRNAPTTLSDRQNLTLPNNMGVITTAWALGGTTVGQAPGDLTFVEETAPVYANP